MRDSLVARITAEGSADLLQRITAVPQCWGAEVSPDRRWVAWSWPGKDSTAQVYIAPTDGSARPRRLTNTPDHAMVVCWANDSHSLIVGLERDGDQRVRLLRTEISGEVDPCLLTDEQPNYFLFGGQLHPNGRWLIYSANFDFESGQELRSTWIYRHDLKKGFRHVLTRPSRSTLIPPTINSIGTHVLYARNDRHPAGLQLWLCEIDGTQDREILNLGETVKVTGSWSPSGQQIVFLAEVGSCVNLGLWDMSGNIRWLIDGLEDPCIEAAWWPNGSDRIVVVMAGEARTRAAFFDPVTGQMETIECAGGTLIPLAPTIDGDWIGRWYSSRQPEDIVQFSPGSPSRMKNLTQSLKQASATCAQFTAPEDFRWHSLDGLVIQGWLYRTYRPAKGTIVCIHGGPTAHSEDRFYSLIQYLVAAGFNVLDPNYRGSTGFGLTFREAIRIDGWGGREQEDIQSGIVALMASGLAEPRRVGVTGVSYGGYSVWCAVTRLSRELVAAAAPICGMTDLTVDYETTRPDLAVYSEEMIGGRPDEATERYHDRSPVNFMANIRSELLIVQGMRDPNVTPQNLAIACTALDNANIPYNVLTFRDEGHGIYKPANRATLYSRLAEFFANALSGQAGESRSFGE